MGPLPFIARARTSCSLSTDQAGLDLIRWAEQDRIGATGQQR